MTHKKQIELRLYLIDHMIKLYQGMPHQIGTPKSEIDDILSALNIWKDETILLKNACDKGYF